MSPTDGSSPLLPGVARPDVPEVFLDRWIPGVDAPVIGHRGVPDGE